MKLDALAYPYRGRQARDVALAYELSETRVERLRQVYGSKGPAGVPAAPVQSCAGTRAWVAPPRGEAIRGAGPGGGPKVVDPLDNVFVEKWGHSTTPSAMASMRSRTSLNSPARMRSAGLSWFSARLGLKIQRFACSGGKTWVSASAT